MVFLVVLLTFANASNLRSLRMWVTLSDIGTSFFLKFELPQFLT